MQDKPSPKFKTGYVVYDRELHAEYTIVKFNSHQLNGDVWYTVTNNATGDYGWTCERWLTLIRKYKSPGLRPD